MIYLTKTEELVMAWYRFLNWPEEEIKKARGRLITMRNRK